MRNDRVKNMTNYRILLSRFCYAAQSSACGIREQAQRSIHKLRCGTPQYVPFDRIRKETPAARGNDTDEFTDVLPIFKHGVTLAWGGGGYLSSESAKTYEICNICMKIDYPEGGSFIMF